ncbi:sigma 54-interacting transcriptional regulator [Consotaella salsifontis]|uniref:Transcriptional regulator containing PAS, AAA-type ATPase, and DNA-binding Fis domains n=1 Tax=Consotaella salsifontis TaxID=1365950 RepID=A0A1T4T1T0_9HYPH|nr:sigma 54-interacting transcriptional regulator [Consotaella salsifontis]SKA34372.1 Transcriptional regulator containing PAS, AAA-type ATPase, and DNA-binding Fis domains [Consotaella salsifontis]
MSDAAKVNDIVLIAPYPSLQGIAEEVQRECAVPIDILLGDLHDGVEAARRALAAGARVLISRGGTARLIEQAFDVPVVDIRISTYDFLRSTLDLIGASEPIAVVGFGDFIRIVRPISTLLGIPTRFFEIGSEPELRRVIEEIKVEGIGSVVGDTVSVRVAREYDLKVRLIETGYEAVREAIEKATTIFQNIRQHVIQTEQLETLLRAIDEGAVLIDGAGTVIYSQIAMLERAGFRKPDPMTLDDLGAEVAGLARLVLSGSQALVDRLVEIGGSNWFVSIHPLAAAPTVTTGCVIVIRDITRIRSLDRNVRRQITERVRRSRATFEDIVHCSAEMQECIRRARSYARTESAIVLYGETGTGKEMFAQSLHNASPRAQGPFVAVNCGAIPPTLIESELFGYVEGAFTGAVRGGKPGLFELAHQGTIFLDEINELDLSMQARLLRVLQEKEVMRVGGSKITPVSMRVIAASNVPLAEEVGRGRFRRDVYYRLNVLALHIPPLRQRHGDVPLLLKTMLARHEKDGLPSMDALTPALLDELEAHAWPGNVRELQNFAERFAVWAATLRRPGERPPIDLLPDSAGMEAVTAVVPPPLLSGSLEEIERRIVAAVLDAEGGNVSRAAKRLAVDRGTVRRKLGAT